MFSNVTISHFLSWLNIGLRNVNDLSMGRSEEELTAQEKIQLKVFKATANSLNMCFSSY